MSSISTTRPAGFGAANSKAKNATKKILTTAACAIAIAIATASGATQAVISPPAPVQAATVLGNPDFAGWCNWKHRTNVLSSAGPWNLYSAYSWVCTIPALGNFNNGPVDANSACRLKYGSGAYAVTTNPNWAHSWQCRR
ncbi:hypothetical protein MTX80_12385 [Gordonia amicalis]|nr:hypothetical protein [Gordonia amicalis]UOG20052.1 hypothetical protein MTX80_12385 [Gordonia amicalis]